MNNIITIRLRDDEYRVPAPDRREAGAYYTNDLDDAIGTLRAMYGPNVKYKVRRVS